MRAAIFTVKCAIEIIFEVTEDLDVFRRFVRFQNLIVNCYFCVFMQGIFIHLFISHTRYEV
jgi:hypothetical protein